MTSLRELIERLELITNKLLEYEKGQGFHQTEQMILSDMMGHEFLWDRSNEEYGALLYKFMGKGIKMYIASDDPPAHEVLPFDQLSDGLKRVYIEAAFYLLMNYTDLVAGMLGWRRTDENDNTPKEPPDEIKEALA